MTMVVVWLGDPSCLDVAASGGKGASLAAMTAAGLPVPAGFVVAANVLEESVDTGALRSLAAARTTREPGRSSQAAPPRAAIVEASRASAIPSRCARRPAPRTPPLRATPASRTPTSTSGRRRGRGRVVDCWASFFSDRALFYRCQKGSLDDLAIAVVVQRMVDAGKAGVLFTVDPVQPTPRPDPDRGRTRAR